ncbi:SMC-Scp complex subunit ScpB [Bacteriovorax sp. Seq25_V]|uniref:SMC-Scp complex subunit ScpB n=1 Tax=Bacteriovorax sp. Seq25_V TaxID=1201288 RepID=UPI000389E130|nr:SMC-Scp complex subunit ScpB [Bacteriovorax sp. Seq25_V]EQC44719.1 segregation and condensation protein B [Bacteriovorax sp. Seq25_V]
MNETNTTEETMAELILAPTDDEMEVELVMFPNDEDLSYPEEHLKLELDYMDEKLQEDKLWKARTGLNDDTICGAIETILFMSDKPVALQKIKQLIDEDMPLRVVHESITRLQKEYESKHHGIRLQEVANGYQFRTKATYSKYVQDLFKVNELVLSPTALEVLAVIAYKQPVSKVEVEKIRGVDSSHIVRGLMDKRLVRVVGRSEEVGKPVLYGTTEEFLEVFNLANLDQLPPEHELQEMAVAGVGKITDISTLVSSDIKAKFDADELNELDSLSDSIKSIEAETDFIKSLKVEEKKRIKGESEVVKTAFDLLEEFLDKTLVSKENKNSVISEIFTAVTDPKVISDLTAGPFNIPEEFEEEEFEMLDLETGEAIKFDDEDESDIELEMEDDSLDVEFELDSEEEEDAEALVAAAFAESEEDEAQEETETEEVINIMGNDEDDEALKLAQALDDAFSKLLGGNSLIDNEMDEDEISNDIDSMTDRMIDEAKDFDIDLSFMKNNDLGDSDELN